MAVDADLLIGDPSLTLNEGVILPWNQGGKGLYSYFQRLLEGLARDLDFSLDTPWGELPEEVQRRDPATATTSRSRCSGATATAAR